jgi:Holliday junction resolvase
VDSREGIRISATYEREFKGILGGDLEVLESVSKTLPAEDKSAYFRNAERPFLVVRAAGSLGADLVALRHDVSFLVEVKSSKQGRIHFSDALRLQEQVAEIRSQCERSGVLPLYAFRLKGVRGDAWRLFTLPGMRLAGAAAALAARVPPIQKTARGNDVLAWDVGLPLAAFLRHVTPAGETRSLPASVASVPR